MGVQRRGGQGGGLWWLIWGGRRDGTQCNLSPAICSSINHGCIYTHPDSHCAPCGDKDVAISECEEGAGSCSGRTGVCGGAFHSLKLEWDLSMLYGLLHTTVWWGEFEPFTEQPPPIRTAVKVKVSQTHIHSHTHTHITQILAEAHSH